MSKADAATTESGSTAGVYEQGLFDPRTGAAAFQLSEINSRGVRFEPPRTNMFSIFVVQRGRGTLHVDAAAHRFEADQLLFFLPYQYVWLQSDQPLRATTLQFHANYLCVETFHAETGCSGTLFNDPFDRPIVSLDGESQKTIHWLLDQIRRESGDQQIAANDAILSLMKLLLIHAARQKGASGTSKPRSEMYRHPVLTQLRELIEQHYQQKHSPSEYAELLHMTPKALGRIVRENLGKTLTALIRERMLTHAKWQLLHTLRPIKEIASELGFRDELYFSRVFRKATGVSPKFFREFETEIRNGSNLSMFSTQSPILHADRNTDHSDSA